MANRLRGNFLNGIVTSITAGNPGSLVLSSGLNLAIPSGFYLSLVLNPPPYAQVSGTTVLSEIVWTSGTYSAGTTAFTVLRSQEGSSSLGAQTNIPYAAGPTTQDFGLVNWQNNGDFPVPTASGQFLVSSSGGVSTPNWIFGYLIPSGGTNGQIVSISGGIPILTSTISGLNLQGLTISGSSVYGNLPNATISGSQIVGLITIISGVLNDPQSTNGLFNNPYIFGSIISGSQFNSGTINFPVVNGGTFTGPLTINDPLIYSATISGSTIKQTTITSSAINTTPITNCIISGNTLTNNTLINTTFSGSVFNNTVITSPIENVNVTNQGLNGTVTLYNNLNSINYYNVASSGNFIINCTYSGGTISGNLGAGQSLSFVLLNTNGATGYVISGFQIDGVNQAMHWQGGAAPTQGNVSATDYYSFSIIKTNNSPTYWVTVGLTKVV